MLAGLGPFIAGLITLSLQKKISKQITIFGGQKIKNLLIVILPVFSFSIIGLENSTGFNKHYFGFIYAFINVIYAFLEEFGWRRYLQNALEGINVHIKYILIGVVWWLWHVRFESEFDLLIFPLICIVGGYLLGQLTDKTKTILPTAMLHTLIIILTNTGSVTTEKTMGVVITITCWILIEQIWKRKIRTLNTIS